MLAKQWAISITTSASHVAPVVRKFCLLLLPPGHLSDLLIALMFLLFNWYEKLGC